MAGASDESTGDPVRDVLRAGVRRVWRAPTEQEFNDDWFTPLDALDVSDERMAEDHEKWALLEQLRAGQIVAVARTAQVKPRSGTVQAFVRIAAGAWRRAGQSEQIQFWRTGHLVVDGVEREDDYGGVLTGDKERYFNVRFDPASFSGRPPPPDQESELVQSTGPATEKPKNLRGAKRKDWWDHLWIEMIRRIRAGELNPKNKTELQDILEEYVDEIGGNYGDSTLKPTASNLFEYLEEIRGK